MVSNALTLVMKAKSPADGQKLKTLIGQMQSLPPDKNPIAIALTKIGTVHFARFVFVSESELAVITTYDGEFDRYIDAFVDSIGQVFDALLAYVKDAPPLPVSEHRDEFKKFAHDNDRKLEGTLYSAYPDWTVQDLLTLIKEHGK